MELADYKRNATNEEDFYLIIGFWEGNKNNIVKIEKLFIRNDFWKTLFVEHFLEDFKNLLSSITNSHDDDEKWKEEIKKLKQQWKKETPNLIRPRFKRDHKNQKRIQCAINYKDLYNYFIPKFGVD